MSNRPAHDTRTGSQIIEAVVDAACRVRDIDWNEDDPSEPMDALDAAVDAWRRRLRENGVCDGSH